MLMSLCKKFSEAFQFDDVVVVEKFIKKTREFNIAILGDSENYEISEVDEPIKNNDVLTFADKYLSGNVKGKGQKGSMRLGVKDGVVKLNERTIGKMKALAEKVFVRLGLYGVVRIDFLYDEESDKIYICEVNAIPGSLAFYFFKKNRIVTNDLILKLITIAERNNKKVSVNPEFVIDVLSEK